MEKIADKHDIKSFELKIFLEGQCNAFLPMSFIVEEERICISYYTEDYIPITNLEFSNPFQMLAILEKVLLCIKDAENHLIPINRFCLNKDSIYFSKQLDRVRLLFKPITEEIEKQTFHGKMEILLNEIKKLILERRSHEYIDMVIDKLSSNIGRDSLINYIGELKREVHICGWS